MLQESRYQKNILKIFKSLADEFQYLDVFKSPTRAISPLSNTKKPLDLKALFEEHGLSSHSVWIKKFTVELLALFGDETLSSVVLLQVIRGTFSIIYRDSQEHKISTFQTLFAETLAPVLVKCLLTLNSSRYNETLGDAVEHFFQKHFNDQTSRDDDDGNSLGIYMNKASIKSMLSVSEYIRIHNFK